VTAKFVAGTARRGLFWINSRGLPEGYAPNLTPGRSPGPADVPDVDAAKAAPFNAFPSMIS
jgi:hypothetical protein